MSNTVHVEGISHDTTEKEVRDFFSFCGKISDIKVQPTSNETSSTKSATVTFEKETAAKTALLLDNTQLGASQVTVKSTASLGDLTSGTTGGEHRDADGHEISQEDKPRSRIVAEYLAHGYIISDNIIERALALDKQHGVSTRFTSALTNFDKKYQARDKAIAADERYSVTQTAANAWNGLNSYFDQALKTPTGQKLRNFYTVGEKQVLDVHNEARHLANLKQGKTEDAAGSSASTSTTAVPVTEEKSSNTASELPTTTTTTLSEKPAGGA